MDKLISNVACAILFSHKPHNISQRHDSEKLGTNSVDEKSCESPEVSPGRRLQGRRPTPPGSQATRSKRFANACAAVDKGPNCQTLLPWLSSDCHRFIDS